MLSCMSTDNILGNRILINSGRIDSHFICVSFRDETVYQCKLFVGDMHKHAQACSICNVTNPHAKLDDALSLMSRVLKVCSISNVRD